MKNLIYLLLLSIIACSQPKNENSNQKIQSEPAQKLFEKLPGELTGINFINPLQENKDINVINYEYLYNGGGVAAGDINNDGLVDLYFTANMRPNILYLNQGDFKFKDLSRTSNTAGKQGWTTGCTMADVNNDGWLDIYVCRSGNLSPDARRNLLFINNKDLSFTESSAAYGIDHPGYSTQASFFDYDRDGDLDMYLLNHNISSPKGFYVSEKKKETDPFAGDQLFRNDGGKFTNVTQSAGIISNPIGFGLGLSTADLNGDGWPDIFVSNDYYEQDYYYINQGNGTFKEGLQNSMAHTSHFSMGVDIADFNNDLLPDVMSLDMMPRDNRRQKLLQGPSNYDKYQMQVQAGFYHQNMRNMLQLNRGDGSFAEVGQLAGVDQSDWSWSILFADYDNDGLKDISITNGYLRDYTNMDFLKFDYPDLNSQAQKQGKGSADILEVIKSIPQTKLANYLFQNQGDLNYKDVSKEWGFVDSLASNGMAYADLDNDGDLDLVLNNLNSEAAIYKNSAQNNYLQVKLKAANNNTFGLGSKVYIHYGDKMQLFEILQNRGYQSSVPPMAYFGLAKTELIDSLIIIWPNGKRSKMDKIAANQILEVSDQSAREFEKQKLSSTSLFAELKGLKGMDFIHKESNFIDYKNLPLIPHLISREGPAISIADINKDGLEDLFIGASANEQSALYLQSKGGFMLANSQPWNQHANQEVISSCFYDANGDGNLDLYLGSGSYEFNAGDKALQDRLFLNDGKGNFNATALPEFYSSTSCIVPMDFDGDGDMDLFIGSRLVQNKFPQTPKNHLLENQGDGSYEDVTASLGSSIESVGLITDALAGDWNQNGKIDLLLAGEYMSIKHFEWNGKAFEYIPNQALEANSGFWNSIQLVDIDKDGDLDIIAGNKGLNDFIKASAENPAKYYGGDLDKDGKYDIICSNHIDGVEYPCASLDELHKQFNLFQKKYNRYSKYAQADMKEILSQINPEVIHEARQFASGVFLNENGELKFKAFPKLAQSSPVQDFCVEDFNQDGKLDLLLVGNDYGNRTEMGRMDANNGILLLGLGSGDFKVAGVSVSGISISGDMRAAKMINFQDDKIIIVAKNNAKPTFYKWNLK